MSNLKKSKKVKKTNGRNKTKHTMKRTKKVGIAIVINLIKAIIYEKIIKKL